MKILVCGGADYIGSRMVRQLLRERHVPIVLDNLSTGHRMAVPNARLSVGDLMDSAALAQTFVAERIEAVVHLCARSLAGESVIHPYLYYQTNVTGTLNLLQAMRDAGVQRLFLPRLQLFTAGRKRPSLKKATPPIRSIPMAPAS